MEWSGMEWNKFSLFGLVKIQWRGAEWSGIYLISLHHLPPSSYPPIWTE